jgi:NRAMP (natural resistance-associated macrophage protein)-like metal ion transporter
MPKDIIEKVAEAPAVALEKTLDSTKQLTNKFVDAPVKQASEYWRLLGPGLTTGAADDDPSGIATYSQTGAQYGFQLLWLSIFTFPLMAVVQEMCARIGLVTGRGLAANIRQHYPRSILYLCTILLFVANILNLGADLGAMAKATQLLYPDLPFNLLVLLFAVVSLGFQIFTTYEKYAHYLKWLALILFSYVFTAFLVPNLDWGAVFRATVTPSFEFGKEQIVLICAILGTTISPYLFFWQTAQEVEEKILEGKTNLKMRAGATGQNIRDMRIDVWSGMLLSNLVMFFIILTCAATLNAQGITTITTAADAAEALRPLAGQGAYLLFALGIIGTGMLAIPVLAGSASYAVSESLGWRHGLYKDLKQATAFYGVIIIAVLIGMMINFIGFDPIKALIYSALANGLVAPIVLVLIVLLSSNKKIMGDRVNSRLVTTVGWGVVALMVVAGIAAVISLF